MVTLSHYNKCICVLCLGLEYNIIGNIEIVVQGVLFGISGRQIGHLWWRASSFLHPQTNYDILYIPS